MLLVLEKGVGVSCFLSYPENYEWILQNYYESLKLQNTTQERVCLAELAGSNWMEEPAPIPFRLTITDIGPIAQNGRRIFLNSYISH